MPFLLDTNIVSELRKGSRCNEGVRSWFTETESNDLWLSVLVIGEIRQGIERIRDRDPASAAHLESWLTGLCTSYSGRILPVTLKISQRWGLLNAGNPSPYIDGYLAATALEHGMSLVTRNERDVRHTGAAILNPFS